MDITWICTATNTFRCCTLMHSENRACIPHGKQQNQKQTHKHFCKKALVKMLVTIGRWWFLCYKSTESRRALGLFRTSSLVRQATAQTTWSCLSTASNWWSLLFPLSQPFMVGIKFRQNPSFGDVSLMWLVFKWWCTCNLVVGDSLLRGLVKICLICNYETCIL